jgi:hypothetical protein
MSVMSGTFPYTYGVFYMTVNRWHVRGPSCHRHGYRHRGKGLDKQVLATMTVMTLMTVNCGLILDARLVCHPRWLSSIIY